MSNYRRVQVPGGTYFFTANLLERRRRLLVEHIDALRAAFRDAQRARPFEIVAIVVLPEGDADYSNRWAQIKSGFSRRLPIEEYRSKIRCKKRERGIWQRRFWEHFIIDDEDLIHHINYVYINPLKHGLVSQVRDWPYSSFHRDVARGLYQADWAG